MTTSKTPRIAGAETYQPKSVAKICDISEAEMSASTADRDSLILANGFRAMCTLHKDIADEVATALATYDNNP